MWSKWNVLKQDSKDLNPRSLTNTPQILTSSNALKVLKCTNAPENISSAK